MPEREIKVDMTSENTPMRPYRILSLDGGGAKGFYTLGVLDEIEKDIVLVKMDKVAGSTASHFMILYRGHSVMYVARKTRAIRITLSIAMADDAENVTKNSGPHFCDICVKAPIAARHWSQKPRISRRWVVLRRLFS
jgi:hypothetical protein